MKKTESPDCFNGNSGSGGHDSLILDDITMPGDITIWVDGARTVGQQMMNLGEKVVVPQMKKAGKMVVKKTGKLIQRGKENVVKQMGGGKDLNAAARQKTRMQGAEDQPQKNHFSRRSPQKRGDYRTKVFAGTSYSSKNNRGKGKKHGF